MFDNVYLLYYIIDVHCVYCVYFIVLYMYCIIIVLVVCVCGLYAIELCILFVELCDDLCIRDENCLSVVWIVLELCSEFLGICGCYWGLLGCIG